MVVGGLQELKECQLPQLSQKKHKICIMDATCTVNVNFYEFNLLH